MHKQVLKKKLADLNRMDLQKLLVEMIDEMEECGPQRMAMAFLDENQKPVAGLVLLADTDISRYLHALEQVEQKEVAWLRREHDGDLEFSSHWDPNGFPVFAVDPRDADE